VLDSPEALASWLADNEMTFGKGATYEQWLSTIKRGWAFTAESKVCTESEWERE